MTEEMNEARSSSWLLRWAIGGFIFVLVLLGAYGTYRFALNQAVANRLQAIRDSGEPATWSEVVALYPPPEVESDNAAVLLREAAARLVELEEAVMQRIPTFSDDAELPALNEPIPAEMLDAMGQYIAANDRAFELIAEAGQRPEAWYGSLRSDVNPLVQIETPVAELRRLARALSVKAMWHMKRGEAADAVAVLGHVVRVAESLRDEPIMISQLVRASIHTSQVSLALQRALSRLPLDEAQLRTLATALEPAMTLQPWTAALIADRGLVSDVMQLPAGEMADLYMREWAVVALHRLLGTVALDHMAYLDHMEQFIAATQLPYDQVAPATQRAAAEADQSPPYLEPGYVVFSTFGQAVSGATESQLLMIDRLEAMRVALAIERYRLAEGALPTTLEMLVPTYLDAVPIGAFDGLPLVYERLPDGGYVVHSEGRNGGRERFEVRR